MYHSKSLPSLWKILTCSAVKSVQRWISLDDLISQMDLILCHFICQINSHSLPK